MKVSVTVKSNSKKGPLVEVGEDNNLTVFVQEPEVDGKANQAVTKLLAKHFNVAKSRVSLIKGEKSKYKLFEII